MCPARDVRCCSADTVKRILSEKCPARDVRFNQLLLLMRCLLLCRISVLLRLVCTMKLNMRLKKNLSKAACKGVNPFTKEMNFHMVLKL